MQCPWLQSVCFPACCNRMQAIVRRVTSYGGSATAEVPTFPGAPPPPPPRSSPPAAPSPGPGLVSQSSSLEYSSLGRLGSTPPKLQEAEFGSQDIYCSKWDDDAQGTAESVTMHDQLHSAAADAEDFESWDDLLSKPY